MAVRIETIALPSPAFGTQRILKVFRYGPPTGPKTYIQAALHADEWPGLLVQHRLRELLAKADAAGLLRGEIIVVPYANPIGLAQYLHAYVLGRYDFDSGVNFNRQFPDIVQTAVTRLRREGLITDKALQLKQIRHVLKSCLAEQHPERESDALKQVLLGLALEADIVLDLHCDGEGLLHLYSSTQHQAQAEQLGNALGAALVLLEHEPGGAPFDESAASPWWKLANALQLPDLPALCFAATVELRGQADLDPVLAQQDAQGIYHFLQLQGVIAGEPAPLFTHQTYVAPLDGVDWITVPRPGILAYRQPLGTYVHAGEVIADLLDPGADDPSQDGLALRSRCDGLFFARMQQKMVRPGQIVAKIAGIAALDYRQAGHLLEP